MAVPTTGTVTGAAGGRPRRRTVEQHPLLYREKLASGRFVMERYLHPRYDLILTSELAEALYLLRIMNLDHMREVVSQ